MASVSVPKSKPDVTLVLSFDEAEKLFQTLSPLLGLPKEIWDLYMALADLKVFNPYPTSSL